jgi:hypothetical protein
MSECICLPKCLFFNDKMANMPVMAEHMKQRFCLGNNNECARYKVFTTLGRDKVPENLFPNNYDRALEIIATEQASIPS